MRHVRIGGGDERARTGPGGGAAGGARAGARGAAGLTASPRRRTGFVRGLGRQGSGGPTHAESTTGKRATDVAQRDHHGGRAHRSANRLAVGGPTP
ncbi:hypothetical protein FRIGORI9N_340017 [Frigoribacterium sp. 9N]|nr:hypothetical protein FRIGORI9N_340017 [Frigoribacterium sp. 9N]